MLYIVSSCMHMISCYSLQSLVSYIKLAVFRLAKYIYYVHYKNYLPYDIAFPLLHIMQCTWILVQMNV